MNDPVDLLRQALDLLWESNEGRYGYITPDGSLYRTPDSFFKITLVETTVTNL